MFEKLIYCLNYAYVYFTELFYLAHELVDVHPEAAISWLAVGCYYYLIGKIFLFV